MIYRGHGCFNCFIILDLIKSELDSKSEQELINKAFNLLIIEKLDDLLVLRKSDTTNRRNLAVTMAVHEPDGSIADFCGNGARVVGKFLKEYYSDEYDSFHIKNSGYIHNIDFRASDDKKIEWAGVQFPTTKVSTEVFHYKEISFFYTKTVEPHLVCLEPLSEDELTEVGLELNIKNPTLFPKGININTCKTLADQHIEVITFERGLNRITQSCGTASVSCANLLFKDKKSPAVDSIVKITTKGGDMMVNLRKDDSWLYGPAIITS